MSIPTLCKRFIKPANTLIALSLSMMVLSGCSQITTKAYATAGLGSTQYNPKLGKTQFVGNVDTRGNLVFISVGLALPAAAIISQMMRSRPRGAAAGQNPANEGKVLLELGYTDFGDFDFNGTWNTVPDVGTDEANAISASIGYSHPINNKVSVIGKLGVSHWKAEVNEVFGGTPESSSASGNDLMLGLGLNYKLNNTWGLRLEWERHQDVWDTDDADAIALKVIYNFGTDL